MSFNPLISLARNAKRQRMEMQCDPQWVLDLAAERDQLRAELEAANKRADINAWNHRHAKQDLQTARNRIAALSAPPAAGVPEGYVLAPIKPTIEMVEAGYEASLGQPDRSAHARVIEQYDAMLAEVPTPPASEQQNLCPHDSWRYGGGPCGDCGEVQFSEEELLRLNRPASEQQRAVVMPKRKSWDGLRTSAENLKADAWNDCLAEFLRLNPHLAKGEGV